MDDDYVQREQRPVLDAAGFGLRVWCVVLGQPDAEVELRVMQREDADEAVAGLVEQVRASGRVALRCGWSWVDGRAAGGLRSCGAMARR